MSDKNSNEDSVPKEYSLSKEYSLTNEDNLSKKEHPAQVDGSNNEAINDVDQNSKKEHPAQVDNLSREDNDTNRSSFSDKNVISSNKEAINDVDQNSTKAHVIPKDIRQRVSLSLGTDSKESSDISGSSETHSIEENNSIEKQQSTAENGRNCVASEVIKRIVQRYEVGKLNFPKAAEKINGHMKNTHTENANMHNCHMPTIQNAHMPNMQNGHKPNMQMQHAQIPNGQNIVSGFQNFPANIRYIQKRERKSNGDDQPKDVKYNIQLSADPGLFTKLPGNSEESERQKQVATEKWEKKVNEVERELERVTYKLKLYQIKYGVDVTIDSKVHSMCASGRGGDPPLKSERLYHSVLQTYSEELEDKERKIQYLMKENKCLSEQNLQLSNFTEGLSSQQTEADSYLKRSLNEATNQALQEAIASVKRMEKRREWKHT